MASAFFLPGFALFCVDDFFEARTASRRATRAVMTAVGAQSGYAGGGGGGGGGGAIQSKKFIPPEKLNENDTSTARLARAKKKRGPGGVSTCKAVRVLWN